MAFDEYNRTVLDHFLNPRNTGELKDPTIVISVENPACGDLVKLSLRLEGGRIVDARAKTFGCAAAIACSSALTELIRGKSLPEAAAVGDADVVRALGGLPEHKQKCSMVAGAALREALQRVGEGR